MRLLTVTSAFLALASAFLLYGLNYDTRRLEIRVQTQERGAEATRADIAVLKAERAHLARPERIDPLARGLGMQPPVQHQFAASAEDAVDADAARAAGRR